MQQNVGGALPGIGTMATYGAMRYANAVFAEDEAGLPAGWQPYATERHGYAAGTSAVSLVFASGAVNITRYGGGKETPEEDVVNGLWRMADFMRFPKAVCSDFPQTGLLPPADVSVLSGFGAFPALTEKEDLQ